jgi:hypothetical protein
VRAELIHHGLEQPGRDGQIERVVAAGAPNPVQVRDGPSQLGERLIVADLTRDEPDTLRQLLPDLLAERRAGVLLHRRMHHVGEVLVGPIPAGETDQGEAGR